MFLVISFVFCSRQELINYYTDLYRVAEKRKESIEKTITTLKSAILDPDCLISSSKSSETSFFSLDGDRSEENFHDADADANNQGDQPEILNPPKIDEDYQLINKKRYLSKELGVLPVETVEQINKPVLSEAQKNKIKVLGTEFGIDYVAPPRVARKITQCEINRNLVMGTSDWLPQKTIDIPKKTTTNHETSNSKTTNQAQLLKQDMVLDVAIGQPPTPMSVDSTPLSELTIKSVPTTTETQITDEGGPFDVKEPEYVMSKSFSFDSRQQSDVFSKRITLNQVSGVSSNCLMLFLKRSMSIPLMTQSKIVDNELLKLIFNDLEYLKHLGNLRAYFFLQDGEFGRNITENLFEKLYEAQSPVELINLRTLQNLVFDALSLGKNEEFRGVSFKINCLPKMFNLGDPDVLDCLSLTYNIGWPLNIVLPADTLGKYDEVFKYLLKVNRISWVLKKIFLVSRHFFVFFFVYFL